jgi:hypothetical protein
MRSYDSAPRPPPSSPPPSRQQVVSLSQSSCVSPVELTNWRGREWWARSQIIRPRESLALYKSFNTLCSTATGCGQIKGLYTRLDWPELGICGFGNVNLTCLRYNADATLQRKSHLCVPFLGISRPQYQFPHSSVCERFIYVLYSQDRSTYFLHQNRHTDHGNI